MRKTGRMTFAALFLALIVLQLPAFGTDSEETNDGGSAAAAEVSASGFTQSADCIEVDGTLWYKVPELIAGQNHLILMDNGENTALLSVTAGEETSAVWSFSVDAMGGSSSSLVCLGYSLGCGESGLTLSAATQDTGGPPGGKPPDGEGPDDGPPPMQSRSAWTCSQGRLTCTSRETVYYLSYPVGEGTVPGCTTEEADAVAVTIYTNGPLFGSCILSQPEAADYVTAGSGYSAPVYSVQVAEALTDPLVEWYVDGESAGTGKTFTAEVLEARQAGRYAVRCVVSGQDTEGYYYREPSCTVNFFVCTGVMEDSFLIFSDVHEEYDNIGAAIEEVMAANDGRIPSLVICTGDWVNGTNVGADKLRAIYLPQIDAQLGGLDTVYVAGNHEAAAGAVEEDLKAGLGAAENGLAGGAGVIFDSAVSARAGKNSRLASGLAVYAVNYACVEQSGGAYAYSSLLPELEAFLRQRAEDYRGELIVIAAHAGLHTLGVQPESRGDGEGAAVSEWSGGSSYNVDGSDQIAALLNEYAEANDMDILFLFGHDHSKGEVEFFLSRGDELISTVSCDEKTTASGILGFLYGHSGYLSDRIGSANEHYSLFRWNQKEIVRDYGRLGETREQRTFSRLAAKQIRFEANGGQGEMAAQTALLGTETALAPNAYTRPGWRFINWNTEADGSGTPYSDGQTVVMTGDLTLYAQWKAQSSSGSSGGGAAPAANPVTVPTASAGAAAHGKVTSSEANARAGDKVTLTLTPDEGYQAAGVTVTDKNGKEVPVTENANGTYSFTMPSTAVTVTPEFEAVTEPDTPDNPDNAGGDVSDRFTDVSKTAWYHDAVQWAVDQGIMNGVSADRFAPDDSTTRAMVVTMLWRLAGEPASSAPAPFTDVSSDAWYADAVAWASETGTVNGTGADTFSPDTPVTREQLAAILYRYAQAQGKGFTGAWMFPLDFTDAADVSEWANEAMHWMVMHGIITGVGDGTLAPQDNATRAQIATMFMRFCEELEK